VRTEDDKRSLLECAKTLQKTDYKNVSHRARLNQKATSEGGKLDERSGEMKQRRDHSRRQGKKLGMDGGGREGRRGRASASSHTVTRRETDNGKDGRREDTGARRKKQYNKRNRSANSDSEMEQEQPHRRTRK
jgi:hypothetical protein